MTSHPAILASQQWLEDFIIRFNICPFAKREFVQQRIRYQLLPERSAQRHLLTLVDECLFLDQHPETETTLLIFPDDLSDFDEFLDFLELAEQLLQQQDYEGIYQLASFHPDYRFAGSMKNDAGNFTNRSPYPMLHLIREKSLEAAVKNYPDIEQVPKNNIKKLQEIGFTEMQKKLKKITS